MPKKIITAIILIIIYSAIAGVEWFKLGFNNIFLREGLYLSTSLIAFIAGLFAIRSFGLSGKRAMTLILLTAGIGYWFLGEVLFNYYEYVLHVNPYPSIADIFYILAYPMLLAGFINEIRIANINWKNINRANLFLFILVSFLLSVIVAYFGIYQAYNPAETFLTNSVAISYGIGDLLLILSNILILVLVWEFRGGKLSRVWLVMFVSFIFTLIADILFAIYTTQYDNQEWFYKSLLDSFWTAGYLLFAYALFEFGFSIQDTYKVLLASKDKNTQENLVNKA